MSDWQPIETAPKDGWILARGGTIENAFWEGEPFPPAVAVRWLPEADCWLLSWCDGGSLLYYEGPTEWMPIPA